MAVLPLRNPIARCIRVTDLSAARCCCWMGTGMTVPLIECGRLLPAARNHAAARRRGSRARHSFARSRPANCADRPARRDAADRECGTTPIAHRALHQPGAAHGRPALGCAGRGAAAAARCAARARRPLARLMRAPATTLHSCGCQRARLFSARRVGTRELGAAVLRQAPAEAPRTRPAGPRHRAPFPAAVQRQRPGARRIPERYEGS